MKYFANIKDNDKVYSLIYGEGIVVKALKKKFRVDGFFIFEVLFSNNKRVHYTEEGIPNWCPFNGCHQTAFYAADINIEKVDFTPLSSILSYKKISNLLHKGELELRCPSGLWIETEECPDFLIREALNKKQYHLFRKSSH